MTSEQPRVWLQRMVARGFQPPPRPVVPVTCVVLGDDGTWSLVPGTGSAALRNRLPHGGIGVLVPSYVSRCSADQHAAQVRHVMTRLDEVHRRHPGLPLTLWVGLQWREGEEKEALRRLAMLSGLTAGRSWLAYAGLALPGPGKLVTIDAVLRLARDLRPAGWLWLDDDIRLEPRCLEHLVSGFLDQGRRGAVGATPAVQAKPYAASRWMRRAGAVTAPPRGYPYAGCMLVAADVVDGGIPARRIADDGFVLFELLDPAADDPYHDLRVLAAARCHGYPGGRGTDSVRRLRRSLYSHVTCMADYSWPAARRYATDFLFFGLWPLAPWDGHRGALRGALRWLIKLVYLWSVLLAAAGLLVRGLANRPLTAVGWGADTDYRVPALTPAGVAP